MKMDKYWELRGRLSDEMTSIIAFLYVESSASNSPRYKGALDYMCRLGLVQLSSDTGWSLTDAGIQMWAMMAKNRHPSWFDGEKDIRERWHSAALDIKGMVT